MCEITQIREHHKAKRTLAFDLSESSHTIYFQGRADKKCLEIRKEDVEYHIEASYYVGVDWVVESKQAFYIEPKLNNDSLNTDYLVMLFSCLKHPEVAQNTEGLFEIKFENPFIEIEQKQDLLTPLLVVQFLQVVKSIVRKGLKKSYYKVECNLNARVKGKVMVAETLKKNVLKNKPLNTYCQYEEFGLNGLENRLLKKALIFVQRYLPTLKIPNCTVYTTDVFNYIMPAFETVDADIDLNDIKHAKSNAFYKEYTEGLLLARLILKRFGYNIAAIEKKNKVKVPPFWIDMSKLFELYILGLLKDRFGNQVSFQVGGNYGNVDYLIKEDDNKLIVDAKYKTYYNENLHGQAQWKRDTIVADIRQISGYARDKKILAKLNMEETIIANCLVIYPLLNGIKNFNANILNDEKETIDQFVQFYKIGVQLPQI
jgi:5-methylcytosine-specific restriction enzyme subunit McrC